MTVEMRDALCEALQLALVDDAIARIEIRARGKCFSTGGDLREFGTAPDPVTAHLVRSLALPGRLLAICASRCEVFVHGACVGSGIEFPAFAARITASPARSEEHTSELQSLMRISYADFCLKKKKKHNKIITLHYDRQ